MKVVSVIKLVSVMRCVSKELATGFGSGFEGCNAVLIDDCDQELRLVW